MVNKQPQTPVHAPGASGSIDLIAIAATMFGIFYGVWWGFLLSIVNQRWATMDHTSQSSVYSDWLHDVALTAGLLVIALSLHAIVVSHVKVMPESSPFLWIEILGVLALGFAIYSLSSGFLEHTVTIFSLDHSVSKSGQDLLKYWLFSTWILIGMREVSLAAKLPCQNLFDNLRPWFREHRIPE